jgi:predicted transcriptional regulator
MDGKRLTIMIEIVRFCSSSRDEARIRNRFGLNSVLSEAYLSILKQRELLTHANGRYQITERGRGFLTSCDRINGIKAKSNPERLSVFNSPQVFEQ